MPLFDELRSLRRIRREAKASVEHRYDPDGRETIEIYAEESGGLLSSFSMPDDEYISGETAAFLDEAVKPLDLRRGIRINVRGTKESLEGAEVYPTAFRNYYRRRIADVGERIRFNRIIWIVMLVLGLVFAGLYAYLAYAGVGEVIALIVDVVSWVFLWEFVDKFFFERPLLRRELMRDAALYGARVTAGEAGV